MKKKTLIDPKKNDHITHVVYNDVKYKVRVVTYIIDGNIYHLTTNLFDEEYTINKLKQFYWKRWSIEEYFKF